MRVSREQMAQHRQRIITAASRRFRERGFAASNVADIMRDAGLTHGGFYGHFPSKAALEETACATVLAAGSTRWAAILDEMPDDALIAIVDGYLSERHRDTPATGCVLPALSAESGRSSPGVRRALTDGIRSRLELLAGIVGGGSRAKRRSRALATLATMVGAVMLARAVDDPALSDEILSGARAACSE